MIRRLALLLLCGLCALELSAEERPYELGLALHSSYYLGELDPRGLLGRHRPGLSLNMSYQPQLHWSWTGELGLRQISARRVDEALARLGAQEDFSRRLLELRLGGRYHFLPLSREQSYLRTRPWSPYLGLGLGLALGGRSSTSRELLLPSLYLGLGVKALLSDRLSLTLDWSVHRCLSSRLEDTGPAWADYPRSAGGPRGIKAQDSYGAWSIALAWRLGKAPCTGCN